MNNKTALIFTVLLVFSSVSIFAQSNSSNPFYKGTDSSSAVKTVPQKNNSFIEKISLIQKDINRNISEAITDYRKSKNPNLLFYIAGFALIYGLVHAMTPGHGKNIILAWILASEKTFLKVLFTSIAGMFFHVFNSLIMVYVIWYFIKGKISVQSPLFIKYFSYGACIVLCIIAVKSIIDLFKSSHPHSRRESDFNRGDSHSHSHNHSHNLEKIKNTTPVKECLLIALGIGMVPCPVAAILTVFMISGKLYAESILTALFFTAGMTLTLVVYTSIVWILRSFITGLKNRHLIRIRDFVLPAAGSLLLIFSGFVIIAPYISF
jgi:ABC-type nickel/cobalt efflux system permease component RcnA